MKVISKFKDYYDFLQGKYGIDEKVVLDRTDFSPIVYTPSPYEKVTFFIGGFKVEGIYIDGDFRYGTELEKYSEKEYKTIWKYDDRYYYISYRYSRYRIETVMVLKAPLQLEGDNTPNDREKCAIIKEYKKNDYIKNPILKEYKIQKVFTPEEIWVILYNWLSKVKDVDSKLTDKEKIVSHGFDIKHSFKNTK